ncbi:MAG: hypothetical protein ACO1SV_27690 [Fimbriimonas sp.]
MAATGRPTRRLEASGTFSCVAIPNNFPPGDFSVRHHHAISQGGWSAFDLFGWYFDTDVSITKVPRTEGRVFTTLISGPGALAAWDKFSTVVPPGSGTWECWVDAIEYEKGDPFSHAVSLEYVGESQHHFGAQYEVYYEIPIGSAFFCKITLGTETRTISGVSTNLKTLLVGTGFGIEGMIGINPYYYAGGTTSSASIFLTGTILGKPFSAPFNASIPEGTYDPLPLPTDPGADIDLDFTGGIALTVSVPPGGISHYSVYGTATYAGGQLTHQAPSEYLITGRVAAMQDPHEAIFNAQTHSESQTFIDSLLFEPTESAVVKREKTFAKLVTFGGGASQRTLYSSDTGMALSANLRTLSVAVANEAPCTKLLGRGGASGALMLRHNARRVLDACDSVTGWTGATLSGGHLEAPAGSSATRSFVGGTLTTAYRYLVADVVAPVDGAKIAAVVEVSGVGDVVLRGTGGPAGVSTPVVFDLCALKEKPGPVDRKTSYWPIGSQEFNAFAWGVDGMNSIELKFPGGSGTYEVHELRLERFTPPRITFLNAESGELNIPEVGAVLVFVFATGDVDGRRALECPAYTITNGSPHTWDLGEFKAHVELNYPGWEVELLVDPDTALIGLGGAGRIVTDTLDESWIRREWDQDAPVLWQSLFHGMRCPPQTGDVVNRGAYGGPAVFRVEKILGAAYSGLVLKGNRKPAEGVLVKAERLPGLQDAGSGTTDDRGRYETGAPWARSGVNHRVTETRGTAPYWKSADVSAPLRTDRRVSFKVGRTDPLPPSLVTRRDGAILGAWLGDEAEDYSLGMTGPGAPTTFDPTRELEDFDARRMVVLAGADVHAPLWVARLGEAGDADLRSTTDLGRSWNNVISLPTCDELAACRSADGGIFVFTLEGGTVRGQSFSPTGAEVAPAWDTNLTGLSDDARLSATAFPMDGAQLAIDLAVKDGPAAYVVVSTNGGLTFA